jgi:hypothetical protein
LLFPDCKYAQPWPIITNGSMEEYLVEQIIDSWCRGKGWKYLVQWVGYGPEHNRWLTGSTLNECKALNVWLGKGNSGAATW